MLDDWRFIVLGFVILIFILWIFFGGKDNVDTCLKDILEDVIPSDVSLNFKTGNGPRERIVTDEDEQKYPWRRSDYYNDEYHEAIISSNYPLVKVNPQVHQSPRVLHPSPKAPPVSAWPKITRSNYASNGEWACAQVLRDIFPEHYFYTTRPNWLKNPETGRNLELDFLNEELRVAIEYNGIQHYVFPNCFHKTKEEFIGQIRRDQYKRKKCDDMGVYLISIPYNVPLTEVKHFIIEKLPEDLGLGL
jgi:hypothetical protein